MTPIPFAAPVARALLRSQSDERLVKMARDGHQGAFDEIVRRYRAPLVAFAAAYATSEKAEDVVQESLTNAWVSLGATEREIALKPWLYTIVRNRALNARRDTRFHEQLDETVDGVRRPEEIVLERDELRRTVAAVAALPEGQRKALIDSAIEGRTHNQIAAELETSPGSVRGMIHRGRVAVRTAAGSIVPLPVLAWASGTGGAVAGGLTAGSVAGGSLAAKGAAVAAIAVLATGSGVVVERSLDDSSDRERQASAENGTAGDRGQSDRVGDDPTSGGDEGLAEGGGGGKPAQRSGGDGRDDDSRRGDDDDDGDDDSSGPGLGDDDDNSGREGGDDDNSGFSENSGPGSGDGDASGSDDDNSGSGSGGSGSGSDDDDSSGSGSGGDEDSSGSGSESDDDSSGPGSGSDDSGPSGSGSDSSGSGSGGSDDEEEDD